MNNQPDCQSVLTELCALVDRELERAREGQIQEHLADCAPCQDEFQAQASVKGLVGRSCRCEPAPAHLRISIVTMISTVSIVYEAPLETE